MVILITGPAGSGKTTLARLIAASDGWIHLCEDDLWMEIGHPSHQLRDDRGQEQVHAIARQRIAAAVQRRQSVAFEFLVYENPPRRLADYRQFLEQQQIPFVTRVLRPRVDSILARQRERGRPSDVDRSRRRIDAEQQLACLASPLIHADWVIDSSDESTQETYVREFAQYASMEAP